MINSFADRAERTRPVKDFDVLYYREGAYGCLLATEANCYY